MKTSKVRYASIILGLLLVVSMLLVSACGGGKTTTTNPVTTAPTTTAVTTAPTTAATTPPKTTTTSAGPTKTLTLGSITAFTLKQGQEIKKWNDLFAKLINDAGGWKIGNDTYKVVWNTYDVGNYGDSNATNTVIQKAIFDDHVQFVLNNFGGDTSVSANQCDQNGVVDFEVGFTDDIVQPTYTWIFRPNGGFFGRVLNYQTSLDYYKQGARTYMAVTGDSEMGRISANQYGQAAKMAGLTVLAPTFFSSDTVDYGPVATKVKAVNPDVVDMVSNSGLQVIGIASALKDAGWKGKIFPGAGLGLVDMQNLYQKVGDYINGMEMTYFDPRGMPETSSDPYNQSLIAAYEKAYGDFQIDGCFWVGSWFILKDAIEKTQSVDKNVVKAYLEGGKQGGVLDMTGYTELFARPDLKNYRTIDANPGSGIGKVVNGQLQFVGMTTSQDQYLISLKVYDGTPDVYPNILNTYKAYWAKYGKPVFPAAEKANSNADWTLLGETNPPGF